MKELPIRLQDMFQLYLMCRRTQLIVTKWPKKNPTKKGPTEVIVTIEYPTGLSCPSSGGWNDQDYLTTRYLLAGLEGETNGVLTKLGQSG